MNTGTDGSFSISCICRFLYAAGIKRFIAISMNRVTDFLDAENDGWLLWVCVGDALLRNWLGGFIGGFSSTNDDLHNGQHDE